MAADRHPRPQARELRPARGRASPRPRPRGRARAVVGGAERPLRGRDRAHRRRRPRAGRTTRACRRESSSSTWRRPRRSIRNFSNATSSPQAVEPGDGRLLGAARGLLDGRDAALCAEGREGRRAALQPGRAVGDGHGRHESHAGRPGRGGRGDPRPGDAGRGREATPRRSTAGPSNCSSAEGAKLRFVNIQNWDARHLALQPRAGPGRPRRRAAVDRRRPGRAAGEGQPGGRADGAGGEGPGQWRDVHRRAAAPRLFHPAGPHGPPHDERPAV